MILKTVTGFGKDDISFLRLPTQIVPVYNRCE